MKEKFNEVMNAFADKNFKGDADLLSDVIEMEPEFTPGYITMNDLPVFEVANTA